MDYYCIVVEGDILTKTAVFLNRVSEKKAALYAIAALLSVGFGVFVILTAEKVNVYYPVPTAVIFGALFFAAQALLIAQGRFDALSLLIAAGCLACVIFSRVSLLYFESRDFTAFLEDWVKKMRALSARDALVTPIGNYNMPYFYFLLIFSRLDIAPIISIKAFSCLFDVVLAYYVMKTVALVTEDRRLLLAAYIVTLGLPTVLMNSAQWAQCDSIYVAFCVMSLYAAVKGNGRLCAIAWTLAFSFKLQAIFILPALAVALFMGQVKPKHLLWIPAVFFLSLVPALIAGRSLGSCLSIYINQTQQYPELYANAPTLWRFFTGVDFEGYSNVTVFLAGTAVLLFMYFCLTGYKAFAPQDLIRLFFISSMLLPYVLPRMHERYFYMADIMSFLYFLTNRKKWYIPAAVVLSSVVGYIWYFTAEEGPGVLILDQRYIALAFLVILATELRELFCSYWHRSPDTIVVE